MNDKTKIKRPVDLGDASSGVILIVGGWFLWRTFQPRSFGVRAWLISGTTVEKVVPRNEGAQQVNTLSQDYQHPEHRCGRSDDEHGQERLRRMRSRRDIDEAAKGLNWLFPSQRSGCYVPAPSRCWSHGRVYHFVMRSMSGSLNDGRFWLALRSSTGTPGVTAPPCVAGEDEAWRRTRGNSRFDKFHKVGARIPRAALSTVPELVETLLAED